MDQIDQNFLKSRSSSESSQMNLKKYAQAKTFILKPCHKKKHINILSKVFSAEPIFELRKYGIRMIRLFSIIILL